MTTNRRTGSRVPAEGEHAAGVLTCGGRRFPVLLMNESSGGMCVVGVNMPALPIGQEIEFSSQVRQVSSRIAMLRHLTVANGQISQLGLQWVD